MPQAIELASVNRQESAPASRRSAIREPAQRFDDVLDRQSRLASEETSAPETAEARESKPARKIEKKSKPDHDQPSEEIDAADQSEKAEDETAIGDQPVAEESVQEPQTKEKPQNSPADDHASETGVAEGQIDPDLSAAIASTAPLTPAQSSAEAPESGPAANAEAASAAPVKISPVDSEAPQPADTTKPGDPPAASRASFVLPKESASAADTDAEESVDLPEFADIAKQPATATPALPADSAANSSLIAPASATVVSTDAAPAALPVTQTPAPIASERDFADRNIDRIVTSVKTELMPTGGTMKIRLDPPNLGQLNIDLTVDQGVLTASFQTSNAEATRLLSHSMQDLKTSLENAGVSVDRIQVKQASPGEQASSRQNEQDQQRQDSHDHPARQEQQRRETLQRMWRKLALGDEPLDLVA